MPLLPEFSRRYPGVTVDLHLDDRFADLVEDRIDVAIRNGRLDDRIGPRDSNSPLEGLRSIGNTDLVSPSAVIDRPSPNAYAAEGVRHHVLDMSVC